MNRELFINSYLEKIGLRFGITDPGLCFEIFSIAVILDKPFEDVYANYSTIVKEANGGHSGGHDGGIDGIFLDEDATLHIFQCKSGANIGDNALGKFIGDFQNIVVHDNPRQLPLNPKIEAQLAELRDTTRAGITFHSQLHFVFNGRKEGQNLTVAQRNEQGTPDLKIWDADELYQRISALQFYGRKRNPLDFTFHAEKSNIALSANDPQTLVSFAKGNVRAVTFRLRATALCELIDRERANNSGNDDHLFSQNIRGFLGRVKANKKIEETLLSDEAAYFPFLNNGITMVAQKVVIPGMPQLGQFPIQTTNPIIVNGLQTTHVIYRMYKTRPERLEGVEVMIRLYDTQDQSLVERITEATNTQSAINFRDKISNQGFMKRLVDLFAAKNVGLLVKRGESFENKLSRELRETLESETLFKFWFASYYERPETAKSRKAEVLETIFDAALEEQHPLHSLFKDNLNSPIFQQMLNVYKIYRLIYEQRDIRLSQPGMEVLQYADEILCYGIYKQLEAANAENRPWNDDELSPLYETALQQVIQLTQAERQAVETGGQDYYHNTYFKSGKSRYDFNRAMGWRESHTEWHA